MNEPDSFIVTVQTVDESFMQDMELPSELPAYELSVKLLEALRTIPGSGFDRWTSCRFECDNCILNDNDTLLKAGAFDGSRIIVIDD